MKRLLIIALALAVLPLAAASACASGMGFYLSGGGGTSDIDTGPYWWSVTNSNRSDVEMGSAGMIFDTNLSENHVFNYRLEIGKGSYKWTEYPLGGETEIDQTVMTHDFGFGIVRTKAVRLWLGPEIRLSKVSEVVGGTDIDMRGFGFGLAMGLNINVIDPLSFVLKASFLNQRLHGDISDGVTTEDITIDDDITLVSAGLVFRFGERF